MLEVEAHSTLLAEWHLHDMSNMVGHQDPVVLVDMSCWLPLLQGSTKQADSRFEDGKMKAQNFFYCPRISNYCSEVPSCLLVCMSLNLLAI